MSEENQDTKEERPQLIKLVDGVVKYCGLAAVNMMEALRDERVPASTQGLIADAINAASAGQWKRAVHLANDVANAESVACLQFVENMHKAKVFHDEIYEWLEDEKKQRKQDMELARVAGKVSSETEQKRVHGASGEYAVDSIPCKEEGMVYADTSFGPVKIPVGYSLRRKPSSPLRDFFLAVHIESGWRSEMDQNPNNCACTARNRAEAFAESSSVGLPQLPEDRRVSNEDETSISAMREEPYCMITVSHGALPHFPNLKVTPLPDDPLPKLPVLMAVADALFARWRNR